MDPASIVLGLALLFVLPGFALITALFPGRRWFGPFHPIALPTMAVVASTAILVVVGSVLGLLPGSPTGDGRGWFQTRGTGAPILETALGIITIILFPVAWYRGAFPMLGRRAAYDDFIERGEPEEMTLLRDLRLEEERLRREARRVRDRGRAAPDMGARQALLDAAAGLDRERERIAERAKRIERRATERRYGARDGW